MAATTGAAVTLGAGSVRLAASIEACALPCARCAIELRIVDAGIDARRHGFGAAGLPATVSSSPATGGLVLDLGAGRVLVPPGLVDLPEGAVIAVQLVAQDGGAPIVDRTGLDRLLAGLFGLRSTPQASQDESAPTPSTPTLIRLPLDATLGQHLLAVWRALGPPAPTDSRRTAAAADVTRDASGAPLNAQGRAEPGVETEGSWRTQPVLLLPQDGTLLPLTVGRRDTGGEAARAAEEHVRLTVEFTHLGSVVLDLRASRGRLEILILSQMPLPESMRASVGQVLAAAVELDGRALHLAWRSWRQPVTEPIS